jgi:hypothetical protein
MALDTYANLQAAIATWLAATGDTEVTGNAADFITLAEQRIHRGGEGSYPSPPLRVRAMETVNAAFSVSSEYTNLPTDFLEMRRLVLPSSPPYLVPVVTEEQLVALFGGNSGTSYVAAMVGQQLQIKPVITAATTFELVYLARFPALSVSQTTNWLLTNAPGIYLFGALLEAVAIGVDDPGRAGDWHARFLAAIAGLQESDRRARFAGSTLQMRPVAVTP